MEIKYPEARLAFRTFSLYLRKMMEVKSNAVKNNTAWEPGMLGP